MEKTNVPWYETFVPDYIAQICLLVPEDEQKNTVLAWLRVSKFFNRNQSLWKVLFSHLFPTKLEIPGKDAVLVLKKSFIDWKNHPEKKDKRTNKTYGDFRYHKTFDYYTCTNLVDYAMKIRNQGRRLDLPVEIVTLVAHPRQKKHGGVSLNVCAVASLRTDIIRCNTIILL